MSNKRILPIQLPVLTMLFACAAFAQNGSISGTVHTQSGNALANATVNLEILSSGVRLSVVTDSNGAYHFDNLPGGTYRLNLSTAQFTGTPSEDITLDPTRPKTVDITVPSTGTTTVASMQVESTTTELDTTTPRIVVSYNTRDTQYLPQPNLIEQNGAGYGAYNLSLLSAGVASNSGFSIARGPVVGGQRPYGNNYYVEGIDNNNRAIPGPLLYVSNEATTEFHGYQNQFPPEWGHTIGGQFNVVARTGTNQFHGALYDYLQNRNLNAVDQRFANQGIRDLPRFDQNRLGANAGFPIIKNSLFFFGDFEYIPMGFSALPLTPVYGPTAAGYTTLSGLSSVNQTNLGVLRSGLGVAPTATSSTTVGGVTIPTGLLSINARGWQNQYNAIGSLDWKIGNSDQLRARYVHNEINANNNGAQLPAYFNPISDRALMASVAEYHNFSPVMVNELRLGYTRFQQGVGYTNLAFPGLNFFPTVQIEQDLNAQLGPGPYSTQPAAFNTYNVGDNMNWQFGRHTIKFGADFRRFIGPMSFANFGNGVFTYSSLNGFLQNQSPDLGGFRSYGNLNFSGNNYDTYTYLNDSWQLTHSINVNLGVKYEYVTVPKTMQLQGLNSIASVPGLIDFHEPDTQKTNFAPLVGIAWSPGFVRNTVFRAGFGMNHNATYQPAILPSVPPGYITTQFVPTYGFYPGFFGLGGFFGAYPVNVFNPTVTPQQARALTTSYIQDQRLPYSMQWNASIQQQIHRMVFEIRYLGVKTVHLPTVATLGGTSPVTASQNLPQFYSTPTQAQINSLTTTLSGLQTMANTNNPYYQAGFTNPISTIGASGWSWYNGLQVQLSQRFSGGLQANLNYTWSHLIDNLSGPTFGSGGYNLADYATVSGSSIYDHRQRATATVLWDVGGIGSHSFNWVRDTLANVTVGGTYTYETPASAMIQGSVNSALTGFGLGGVVYNPNGTASVGSGVTPVTNSTGQIVAYQATNPNAQYISAGTGNYTTGNRYTFGLNPINNFDVTAYKRFAVRDRFSFEVFGDAYNVLNHPQYTTSSIHSIGVNPLALTANFLTPGALGFGNPSLAFPSNARMLQVGLRLLF